MTYQQFARLYDRMMDDQLYNKWVEYTTRYLKSSQRILELGCGTGQVGILLAQRGFSVTGLDLSTDMLLIARDHQVESGVHFPLIERDMRDLSELGTYDAILSFNDSFCYLPTIDDLRQVLNQCYQALDSGGQLLFDVHSIDKIRAFDGYSYHAEIDDQLLVWNSYEGEHPYSCEHDISIFSRTQDGLYQRYDECHYERTYPLQVYKDLLKECGFTHIEVTSDFNSEWNEQSMRWFFRAVKGD